MDQPTLVLILMLIIGAISIFGGFRMARVRRQNATQIRAIATIIAALVFGAWYLYSLGVFDSDEPDTVPITQVIPTDVPIQTEPLILNETSTYALNTGDSLALTYTGELDQVVTLTVKPDSGNSPPVEIMIGDPPVRERSIQARGLQTIICGYQFTENGTVTFVFEALEITSYTIDFVDGNACRG